MGIWTFLTLSLALLLSLASFSQGVEIIDPDEWSVNVREDSVVEIVCKSTDGSAMSWRFSGMAVVEDAMTTITTVNMEFYQTSTLRFESVTPDNGGRYECHNPDDYFDKSAITLNILADDGSRLVEINNPTDEETQVTLGQDLWLRCIGAAHTDLIWKHNGTRIESSAKDVIRSAADVEQQITTSLLTRNSMSEDDAGRYVCQDADEFFNQDSVTVDVVESQPGRGVEIIEPDETPVNAREDSMVEIVCKSTDGSAMRWKFNDMPVTEDAMVTITTTSILRLESVTPDSAGTYECHNPDDLFDKATVALNVLAEDGSQLVEIDNPTDEETQVTLGQDLWLHCIGAADATLIWKHNGMRIESSTKGIITSATDVERQITMSLLMRSSMSEDHAGRYVCQDADDFFNQDFITVDVVDSQPGRASVVISQPQGPSLTVQPGETLNLHCEGDATTSSLSWAKDGTLIISTELWNGYTISAGEDVHSGTKFSMLIGSITILEWLRPL